jgi:hypothetical protein
VLGWPCTLSCLAQCSYTICGSTSVFAGTVSMLLGSSHQTVCWMQLTTTSTRPAAQDVLQPVQNFAFSSIMACGLSIARQWGADAHPACERRSSWAGVVLMRSHCWTAGSSRRRIDAATWCLSSWRLPFHCCGLRNLCGGLSSKHLSAELALNSISAACMMGNG